MSCHVTHLTFRPFNSGQPLPELAEIVVRARDDLHGHYGTHSCGGGGTRIGRSLHAGDVAAEENRAVTAANLFPASKRDVRGLEGGIRRFEQGAESLAFDHSNCLLSHKVVDR